MTAIAKLYHGYGNRPTNAQGQIAAQGEAFVKTAPEARPDPHGPRRQVTGRLR